MLKYKFDKEARRITDGCLWDAPSKFFSYSKSNILDLGGGSGNFGLQLKANDNNIINFDVTSERFSNDVVNVLGDMHLLPFGNNTFDIVLARAVLHHTSDLNIVLSEIRRVLKTGGHLLVEDPCAYNPFACVVRKTISTDIHDPDEKPFSPAFLVRKVRENFNIVRIEYYTLLSYTLPTIVNYVPKCLKKVMRKITFGLFELDKKLLKFKLFRPFCGYIMVVAYK